MKIIVAFALLAVAATGSVSAQPLTRTATVSTAGLDLATAKGRRALDLRVLHTASELCGTPSPVDARGRARFDRCRADLRADAARAVAALTARATVQVAER